jgi:putative transposase
LEVRPALVPARPNVRRIFTAATAYDADLQLDAFARKWDAVCPMVSQTWRRHWGRITPSFAHPAEIRKAICTTTAVESLNMSVRKIIGMRGSFPNDEAAMKLLWSVTTSSNPG